MLLAVTFGILPGELEQRLTSSDFVRLAAYYRISPWGPWRDDLRVAQLSALTFNINRGKGQEAMSPLDFIYDPIAAEEREKARDQAMLDMFDALATKGQHDG